MPESVVLLHGLARTSWSMSSLGTTLRRAGFVVHNIGYPSRIRTIEDLVAHHLAPRVRTIEKEGPAPLHFVTHSMGGILVRLLLRDWRPSTLGRVVMLGPPNQGSELVDRLGGLAPFGWLNGPAGHQLGTGADCLPNRLGPVDYEVGVIAGTRPSNPFFARLIGEPSDGKVSVRRAKVEGMSDFVTLPITHSFMMSWRRVHELTLAFLRTGRFAPLS